LYVNKLIRHVPDYTSCSGGQKAKQQGNSCKITKILDLVHPSGYLHFKVNGSNAVGQITSDIENADLYHRSKFFYNYKLMTSIIVADTFIRT